MLTEGSVSRRSYVALAASERMPGSVGAGVVCGCGGGGVAGGSGCCASTAEDARITISASASRLFAMIETGPFPACTVITPHSSYGKVKHLRSLRKRLSIALAHVL